MKAPIHFNVHWFKWTIKTIMVTKKTKPKKKDESEKSVMAICFLW